MKNKRGIFLSVVPIFLGAGFAWIGFGILKNENRLLIRKSELEEAFNSKSKKVRRSRLLGKKN